MQFLNSANETIGEWKYMEIKDGEWKERIMFISFLSSSSYSDALLLLSSLPRYMHNTT